MANNIDFYNNGTKVSLTGKDAVEFTSQERDLRKKLNSGQLSLRDYNTQVQNLEGNFATAARNPPSAQQSIQSNFGVDGKGAVNDVVTTLTRTPELPKIPSGLSKSSALSNATSIQTIDNSSISGALSSGTDYTGYESAFVPTPMGSNLPNMEGYKPSLPSLVNSNVPLGTQLRLPPEIANTDSPVTGGSTMPTWSSDEAPDWRVRLSIPKIATFMNSAILAPIVETNGLIFPLTPQIRIGHKAGYEQTSPVHTNYEFINYKASSIETININAQFFVEDYHDGVHWVAAKHYLDSVTKMFYGESEFTGAPPPVVKLYGYGDHVFNGTPVVITGYSVDLPNEVDYVEIPIPGNYAYVPVVSTFSIQLQVLYSRESIRTFDFTRFVNGGYVVKDGKFI